MSNPLIPPSYTPTPVSAEPLQPNGAQDGVAERSLVDGLNNATNQSVGSTNTAAGEPTDFQTLAKAGSAINF